MILEFERIYIYQFAYYPQETGSEESRSNMPIKGNGQEDKASTISHYGQVQTKRSLSVTSC